MSFSGQAITAGSKSGQVQIIPDYVIWQHNHSICSACYVKISCKIILQGHMETRVFHDMLNRLSGYVVKSPSSSLLCIEIFDFTTQLGIVTVHAMQFYS